MTDTTGRKGGTIHGKRSRVELCAALDRAEARAEAAEARAYTLAVAIMGGEDAPGYADSIDTGILADQLRKERADQSAWIDACVKVGREAAEAERDALAAKLALAMDFIRDLEGSEWPLDAQAKRILAQLTADTPKEGKDDDV